MTVDPKFLVEWIVWYASGRELHLTNIRIVKFLYLFDLYHARQNQGITLTKWPWKFVHYGPYCGDASKTIERAVKEQLIATKSFVSKFTNEEIYLYYCDVEMEPFVATQFPSVILGNVQEAIDQWGDDTAGLLDHVYFMTEPMKDAEPGSLLDFRKAQPVQKVRPLEMRKLSKKQVVKGKRFLQDLSSSYKKNQCSIVSTVSKAILDSVYDEALSFLEDPDLDTGITGTAKLGKLG